MKKGELKYQVIAWAVVVIIGVLGFLFREINILNMRMDNVEMDGIGLMNRMDYISDRQEGLR